MPEERSEMTLEEKLNLLFDWREEMRALDKQKSEIQERFDALEYTVITAMQEAGLRNAGIERCTVTVKQEKYPKVEDMDAFVSWCADNGRSDMIQRRVSKAAFDEYFDKTNEYPDGIDTYDKVSLNMRRR